MPRKPSKKHPSNLYTAAERLICLITLLADRRWHTTEWLAGQFHTTERTILRDLDRIERAAKAVIERRPGKGIRLTAKYFFRGIEAGPNEAINLILAVAFSPRVGFSLPQVARTLDKLRNALPPEFSSQVDWFRSRFHFDIPAHTNGLRFLDDVRNAILHCHKIVITHLGIGDGTTDEHQISPYGLVYYHDKWFLIGFDYASAERRVFRVDRFITCVVTKETFAPPDDFDAEEHWYKVFWKQYGRNAETIVLDFDPAHEERLRSWDSVTVKKLRNGLLRATFKAMNPEWLRGFVLSHGQAVTVIEPAWLRTAVRDEAAAVLRKYRQMNG